MATYYVWSGASGTNAGTSWTNAYTAFGSAVTAATASGDLILVHYTHQEASLAADTTYTFGNHVNVISVDKDNSDTPTAMGTGGWVGDSTNNRAITLAGGFKVYFYGMTFRVSGALTSDDIVIGTTDGCHFELDTCYLWQANTVSGSDIIFGGSGIINGYVMCRNCTLRLSNTGNNILLRYARLHFLNCTLSSDGSAPSTAFALTGGATINANFEGCDFSHCTGTLVGNSSTSANVLTFTQCKLGANVTILATQTPANKSSGAVYLFDCASGDTHGFFGYYDAFGSIVRDTTIYFTSGAAQSSWALNVTTNASRYTPFCSPWIDLYHTGTSAITPYIEILTGDNAGNEVLTDGKVWIEVEAKTTSGSTQSTLYTDRPAPLAAASNQASGAGTGSWTYTMGGAHVAWSGKLGLNSSITPAENGHIRARICATGTLPNYGTFIDPQIRT